MSQGVPTRSEIVRTLASQQLRQERHLCRKPAVKIPSPRGATYSAPDGAGIPSGRIFYKDVAPMGLSDARESLWGWNSSEGDGSTFPFRVRGHGSNVPSSPTDQDGRASRSARSRFRVPGRKTARAERRALPDTSAKLRSIRREPDHFLDRIRLTPDATRRLVAAPLPNLSSAAPFASRPAGDWWCSRASSHRQRKELRIP